MRIVCLRYYNILTAEPICVNTGNPDTTRAGSACSITKNLGSRTSIPIRVVPIRYY